MNDNKYRAMILHAMQDINRVLSGFGPPIRVELPLGATQDEMRKGFNAAIIRKLRSALAASDTLLPVDSVPISSSVEYEYIYRLYHGFDALLKNWERTNVVETDRLQTGVDRI